ncbi:MAG: OmpA family protein, partial [Endomicrobia bacterium]|nr:OmpA family protein [Endomicrobiia bacterium]
ERIKKEEAVRIAEEAKITKEISDSELLKQKAEAQERRKRPMLKTYSLTTNFETNSYFLTQEYKKQIKEIAEEVKKYEFKHITIEGHTDSTGTKEINKRLSRQRARSVHDEFIKAGIPVEKMSHAGFADTMSVKSNKTAEGRAANRRTEIFVE